MYYYCSILIAYKVLKNGFFDDCSLNTQHFYILFEVCIISNYIYNMFSITLVGSLSIYAEDILN